MPSGWKGYLAFGFFSAIGAAIGGFAIGTAQGLINKAMK